MPKPYCDHCGEVPEGTEMTRTHDGNLICPKCDVCEECETLICEGCEFRKNTHGACCEDEQNTTCTACGFCSCFCH